MTKEKTCRQVNGGGIWIKPAILCRLSAKLTLLVHSWTDTTHQGSIRMVYPPKEDSNQSGLSSW